MQKSAVLDLGASVASSPKITSDREYQNQAVKLVREQLAKTEACCLEMPTGTGKTRTVAMAMANEFRHDYDRIIILIHQDPLPSQWASTVSMFGFGNGLGVMDVKSGWDLGAIVSKKTKATFPEKLQKKFHHHGNKVIICMLPTLKGKLAKLSDAHLSGRTLLIYDEAHKTRFHDVARELENRIRQIPGSFLNILGVTATPARHPNEATEFHDDYYFPKDTWVSVITAQEAMDAGYWKRISYIENTSEYISEAADLFSGLSVGQDGEVADTKQSAVMRQLIPSHFRDWKAEQDENTINETCLWACVDRVHAHALSAYIQSQGMTSMVIDGTTENKQAEIDRLNAGDVQHVVVIGCLQEGADIPRISQVILCRIFGSTATICQIVGRGVRPWLDLICRVFDFGQNWSDHPYPCQIDWQVHQNSKKMFRDPAMSVCQDPNCRKRHGSIPKPLHSSGDRKIIAMISVGEYNNKEQDKIDLDAPLVCWSCGETVTYDEKRINKYALWQARCRLAIASGTKPPKPNFRRSGITVGNEWGQILTPRVLYELDLWELDEPNDNPKPPSEEDKKKKWLDKAELVAKRQNSHKTKQRAIEFLPDNFKPQSSIDMGRCRSMARTDLPKALRSAIFVQYVNGRPPSGAFAVFPTDDELMRNYGPGSAEPLLDSKGVPLKMPSAIKGKLYDQAAANILPRLNINAFAQNELSEWLQNEIEKLSDSERQPSHPKFRFLKTWAQTVMDIDHEEIKEEEF